MLKIVSLKNSGPMKKVRGFKNSHEIKLISSIEITKTAIKLIIAIIAPNNIPLNESNFYIKIKHS